MAKRSGTSGSTGGSTGGRAAAGAGVHTVVQNRRASFDYHLGERLEAGLVLTGTEVKSLRGGRGSLAEAWVKVDPTGEAWLMQCHIPEYSHGGYANHDPVRPRKLLLHRRELERLGHAVGAKGVTLVPLRIHFREGLAKLELAVGTGKNVADKRRSAAERDAKREMDRARKVHGRR